MQYLMDVMSFLPNLVEALLLQHSPADRVLVVHLEVKILNTETWAYEERQIYLVFRRPDQYPEVLWLVADFGELRTAVPIKFQLRSNGGRMWRENGISTPLHELNKELDKLVCRGDTREALPIERRLNFDTFHPFEVRLIHGLERDPDDERGWMVVF